MYTNSDEHIFINDNVFDRNNKKYTKFQSINSGFSGIEPIMEYCLWHPLKKYDTNIICITQDDISTIKWFYSDDYIIKKDGEVFYAENADKDKEYGINMSMEIYFKCNRRSLFSFRNTSKKITFKDDPYSGSGCEILKDDNIFDKINRRLYEYK